MKGITTIFFIINFITLFAQTATGNLETYIDNIIDNSPGSSGDNYVVPNQSQINSWNSIVNFILDENLVNARSNADMINYQITEFIDISISPNQVFYVLEEKSEQTYYWGTYVFSKTPSRNNLIIQAPHSKYDTNTGKQAVFCFKNIVARAVFINGTHRCNSDSFSSCSGTTSVCGSSDSYRVSDMAHNVNSMFQKTTEILFNNISNSVFIQLHGFGKNSTDPYVIMSNGTRETPTTDYAVLIKDALLVEDNTLTFKLAHIDQSWTRLIGFTNTQGRLINNSTNPCNTSAATTTGRFIHIEQEKSKLRDNQNDWIKMSNALANVFSSTLSVNDYNFKNILIGPNPTSGKININNNYLKNAEIFSVYGQKINVIQQVNNSKTIIDLNNQTSGVYFLRLKTEKGMITKKIIKL